MISVIVPLYNAGSYVRRCLECIQAQTCRDFELIVVDDGSTDDSVKIAEDFLKDSGLDHRIIRKENGGQSSSRNAGLRIAQGEHVVFIDSDDVVSPDFLSSLEERMEEGVDFTFCDYKYVKTQDPPVDAEEASFVLSKDEMIDAFLKRTVGFVVPSMLFRRDFLLENDLFFREEIRYSEDQLFIWECVFAMNRAVCLKKKMYGYYLRGQSIMTGSAYERIVKGYEVYADFCQELNERHPSYERQIAMILPRWDLGTLYTSASLMDYEDYEKIYRMMDGRKLFGKIRDIGEPKACLLAAVAALSPRLLYGLCRRMDLNG